MSSPIDLLSDSSKFGTQSNSRAFSMLPKHACREVASHSCAGECYVFNMLADRVDAYLFVEKNFALTKRADFVTRIIYYIQRANVPDFRIHSGGDFYDDKKYLPDWIEMIKACPDVKFTLYTRRWRIQTSIPGLTKLASLPNVNLWLSEDVDTGRSPAIPNTRVAWLACNDGQLPPDHANLAFRATAERLTTIYYDDKGKPKGKRRFTPHKTMGNHVTVCPHENGLPNMPKTCVQCRICMWRTG